MAFLAKPQCALLSATELTPILAGFDPLVWHQVLEAGRRRQARPANVARGVTPASSSAVVLLFHLCVAIN